MSLLGLGPGSGDGAAGSGQGSIPSSPPALCDAPGVVVGFM